MASDSLVAVQYGQYPRGRVYHLSFDRGSSVFCGQGRDGRTIVLNHQPDRVRVCKRCEAKRPLPVPSEETPDA